MKGVPSMRIVLASSNPHKVKEFRHLFSVSGLDVRPPADWGLAALSVEESGLTFTENALAKARAYCTAYNMPTVADDSGIRVDALAGAPGVRSARFGPPGLDDEGRARYLLTCMDMIEDPWRGAHYVCMLAFVCPQRDPVVVAGKWYGRLGREYVKGSTGFGYDPVFIVPSRGVAAARLTVDEKDQL
ncbi:MAG: non-canonical purine NTP pyrophosphatase, partial [Chloroflexota bacterium]